jgi:hypothetical protein
VTQEITDKDIEWEKIENPDPAGPYWQPVNPYARYFWKELLFLLRQHKEYERQTQESSDKLAKYFAGRIAELEK